MPSLVYGHSRENLLRTATSITLATGTAETGYGLEKLYDASWASPFKATGGNVTIVAAWASAVLPELAAILNSTLDVAALLQGNATDSWGAPTVSVAFGTPSMNARGYFTSPHKDLSALTAQLFWRLHIVGNSRNVTIGELFLGPRYSLSGFLYQGLSLPHVGTTVTHRTYMQVPLSYEQTPRHREIDGTIMPAGSDLTAVHTLLDTSRMGARPMVLVPRDDVDDAWMAKIATARIGEGPIGPAISRIGLPIEMVSRGMPWLDPDEE